jgi:hypothetical protein
MSALVKTMALMEQIVGTVVTIVTLLDIFLTVLYARAGTALFSSVVARGIWLVCFVWVRVHSAAIAAERSHSAAR